ncbi:MAG TPA: efflux RND transporter permease subunit [Verrucomicrobiae bacterium]|jgi:HAE1 family hydrophobic/amphiphilic exporter-1|nr:efflux RND transporter permease subunit [Verrucomicrobiae bacterium]
MPGFSIRNPYFIIVICLTLLVIGVTSLARMPVDLFPPINLPEVVVATFYTGMPPEDIETDITDPLERFFTLASGVDHMESRSMLGVSIIRVYFQPGTSADADVSQLSNLALADLKRLPPGTLPPVVLKFDASSLPVALVTVKGEGLNETQLHDYAQFQIRNQIAVVPGAEIPGVFGGIYRQIMVYVDPYKLASRQLSVMDVVGAVNDSNLILPAGDVKMGPYDYFVYSNSLVDNMKQLGDVPLKVKGNSWVTVNDVGKAEDAHQIQYNIVRVDGQRSAYIPIMKQGGDTNTIAVVDGVRQLIKHLYDIPQQMKTSIVFDQSVYVKEAIDTVLHEGFLGLILTSLMILIFLGSFRATSAVLLSIPLSALAAFVVLAMMGGTVNTMILGGMALAFSRVIDNSVISLENIYRHLEMGAAPMIAAEVGGQEVSLAVLAATLVDVVDFFPVVFLYGVAKFLFSALALAFCLSLLASFVVAMTVIPLFCSRFLKAVPHVEKQKDKENEYDLEPTATTGHSWMERFNARFNRMFNKVLDYYEHWVRRAVVRPGVTVAILSGVFLASLAIYPLLGLAFFPKTDAGQFTINLKVPTGTRIEIANEYVAKVEDLIRHEIEPKDFKRIVSNIGVVPDFSSLYTTNSGPYTATVQVALNEPHRLSSFEYMDRVQKAMASQFPDIRTFFSSGSMVDAILNSGAPAPIDVQVSSPDLDQIYGIAQTLANRIREVHGVGQIYIPQDMNYPALRLDVDRVHAGELGLTQKDVVDNVITALNSNYMIAPNYWVDRKSGNDYYLTVQYFEHGDASIHNMADLGQIPLRDPGNGAGMTCGPSGPPQPGTGHSSWACLGGGRPTTVLKNVVDVKQVLTPTEVDHYQIQRAVDIFVTPNGEDLGRVTSSIRNILATEKIPSNVRVNLRGMVQGMEASFKSFAFGFLISFLLLFLILTAQFKSFIDPFLIMLAIPMGFVGVLIILPLTGSTLNVMSLMGVLMLVGIADSNSILIVDFAHNLEKQGMLPADAVITACRVRLRPILMTSLATIIGMIPMALKLGTGAEQYAPMAKAIIGGLTSSVVLTIFIVPAAYLLVYGKRGAKEVANPTPGAAQ